MSITYIDKGDMFYYSVEALVNPVNCEGVSGKGLAKEFKNKYPENQKHYEWECERGIMKMGHLGITYMGWRGFPRRIVNFPTKHRWRDKSEIEFIGTGLVTLERMIHWFRIESIAIPALGCGLGGLKWDDVKPLITKAAEDINVHQIHEQTRIFIFEPQ
jgi:O-acetyl-ADP-ribose deacetylase (regulator of RNase III)